MGQSPQQKNLSPDTQRFPEKRWFGIESLHFGNPAKKIGVLWLRQPSGDTCASPSTDSGDAEVCQVADATTGIKMYVCMN